MNLLLICEIQPDLPLPCWDETVKAHILEKAHPNSRAESCTAWNLLAHGLMQLNISPLPKLCFEASGKPRFLDSSLHFSLAHNGKLAAALISEQACAVDLERKHPELSARLESRCLSDAERRAGLSCFEGWTRKECIVKLNGTGFNTHPAQIDSLQAAYSECFFSHEIHFSSESYQLTALCANTQAPTIIKILPEELF